MIGERMMNPETTTKAKEKELFKQFMEVSQQAFPADLARSLALTLSPIFRRTSIRVRLSSWQR